MNISFSMRQAGMFRYACRTVKSTYSGRQNDPNGANAQADVSAIRRMLSESGQRDQYAAYSRSVLENSASYADSLREARTKAKNTALKLKKLRYDFKAVSTQILRSKTSYSAKQAASKARREVIRLKRQRLGGDYDEEELRVAIVHAQAMERVARKKVKHLLEEEMMQVADGPWGDESDKEKEQEDQAAEEAVKSGASGPLSYDGFGAPGPKGDVSEAAQEQMQALQDMLSEQMAGLQEMMQLRMEELQQAMEETAQKIQEKMLASMQEQMSKMADEMSESMKELFEESGLSELIEGVSGAAGREMDSADFKMLKIKHRSKEMRDIAEADAEYLKALFNRLAKEKQSSMEGSYSSTTSITMSESFSMVSATVTVAGGDGPVADVLPVDAAGAPSSTGALPAPVSPAGGGFDVSV